MFPARVQFPMEVQEIHNPMRHVVPARGEAETAPHEGIKVALMVLTAFGPKIRVSSVSKLLSALPKDGAAAVFPDLV
jgi:hypothetical protein